WRANVVIVRIAFSLLPMKTLLRVIGFSAALGAAFFSAGCSSTTTRTTRVKAPPLRFEMTLVESSTDRQLSPAEMEQVRPGAVNCLASQKDLVPGDYYVRVNFTPDASDANGDWAIVRLTSRPEPTYSLVAAYPAEMGDDAEGDVYAANYYDYDYGYAYDP